MNENPTPPADDTPDDPTAPGENQPAGTPPEETPEEQPTASTLATPPDETARSEAITGESGAPDAARTRPVFDLEDERPGVAARIVSLAGDAILWGFLLGCIGFIVFEFSLALSNKAVVRGYTTGAALRLPNPPEPRLPEVLPASGAPTSTTDADLKALITDEPWNSLGFDADGDGVLTWAEYANRQDAADHLWMRNLTAASFDVKDDDGVKIRTEPILNGIERLVHGICFSLFPVRRDKTRISNVTRYFEEFSGVLLAFVLIGVALGILFNLLNWSWIARVSGFGPLAGPVGASAPRGPTAPWWRRPDGLTAAFTLVITLGTGWFVTEIEIRKVLEKDDVENVYGKVGQFLNVFGVEKVTGFNIPADVPVPQIAFSVIDPEWHILKWPDGEYQQWWFKAHEPGEYVFDNKVTIRVTRTADPGAEPVDGVREVPIDFRVPAAELGLSGTEMLTSDPGNATPPLYPEVWDRVTFFQAYRAGNYTFTRDDGAETRIVRVVESGDDIEVKLDDQNRILPISMRDGAYPVRVDTRVPLSALGMDDTWALSGVPEGVDGVLTSEPCLIAREGVYDFRGPIMEIDGNKVNGDRVLVHVLPSVVAPRDNWTKQISLIDNFPSWTIVSGRPRAWSRFDKAVPKMIETVFLALMATVLAVPIAFVLAFLAAQNLMKKTRFGTFVYYIVRLFMNLMRSIEPLCWAIIFGVWVGFGTFAGVLALMIHTIAALAKLYSEQIEGIDQGPVEAITATGASALQVVRHAIVPQIIPPFISFTMYRWDINVRMAPILGFVGGGGIGSMLQTHFNQQQWQEVGVIILLITIVVAAMDLASARIRARIT